MGLGFIPRARDRKGLAVGDATTYRIVVAACLGEDGFAGRPTEPELSHWLAEGTETLKEDQERRSWLFALTVVASAATGTVSASRRLVRRPTGRDFEQDVSYWRSQAEAMLPSDVAPA